MSKIITSFGSAFIKPDEPLYSEIEEIGGYIGSGGWNVCSGGFYGSMEAISKGVKSAGGKTIGVTVMDWATIPNKWIDEDYKMNNLMERILKMISLGDAYIIFKGGTGTLVKISVTLELMNKKQMPEKMIIFYTDFWLNMVEILKQDSPTLKDLIERNCKFIQNPVDINQYF